MAHLQTMRTILALAVQKNYVVHHVDVSGAYLYAPLDSDVYIHLPEGVNDFDDEGDKLVGKLNRAMYGIGQAGRAWNNHGNAAFEAEGYVRCLADTCAYRKEFADGDEALVSSNVDDFLFAAPACKIETAKQAITKNFKHTDYGPVTSYLGMRIQQDMEAMTITVDQETYAMGVLARFKMEECKPIGTPMMPNSTLPKEPAEEQGEHYLEGSEITEYRALVGCLMYLVVATRPYPAFAVSKLGRYSISMESCNTSIWSLIALRSCLRTFFIKTSTSSYWTCGCPTTG